jgi:GTP-binding protein HflX
VADASSPRLEEQMNSVERILRQLHLEGIPRLLVLNKTDRLEPVQAARLAGAYQGIPICARDPRTFPELLNHMERLIWPRSSIDSTSEESRLSRLQETNSMGAS